MSQDALSTGMFWVGALTALTPIVIAGVVVVVVWRGRKRGAAASGPRPEGE